MQIMNDARKTVAEVPDSAWLSERRSANLALGNYGQLLPRPNSPRHANILQGWMSEISM
jgi:hypothetical protein